MTSSSAMALRLEEGYREVNRLFWKGEIKSLFEEMLRTVGTEGYILEAGVGVVVQGHLEGSDNQVVT